MLIDKTIATAGILAALLLVAARPADAATLRVPADFGTIQAAIDAAANGDEIIVEPGTYLERINLLGKAITLRSAGSSCNTIIDGTGGQEFLPVVACESGEGPDTVIRGFLVTGGTATLGAGMHNYGSSPTVQDCRFEDNTGSVGAGMMNQVVPGGGPRACPTVINCEFVNNLAESVGGGMSNFTSDPVLIGCTFTGNIAEAEGGAMCIGAESTATLIGCRFVGNACDVLGGGIAVFNSSPTMTGCIFESNVAPLTVEFDPVSVGGAMFISGGSDPRIDNCLFTSNAAGFGGGLGVSNGAAARLVNCTFTGNSATSLSSDGGGAVWSLANDLDLTNCILWNDSPGEIEGGAIGDVTYCIVQGGWPGVGNKNQNPLFADPFADDYRLTPASPARNMGLTEVVPPGQEDLAGNPRIAEAVVDMGAYECVIDPCTGVCVGAYRDCNGNGIHDACDIGTGTSDDCNENGTPDECETAPTNDVIFIIDGSGSIETEAFDAQIDGIVACLCGPTAFPADGSVAIALIQFSNTDCEEIPLTVIDTPATASELCTRIAGIAQEEGSTNLTPALERAAVLFRTQGRDGFRQLVLSTDAGLDDPDDAAEAAAELRSQLAVKVCTALVGSTCPQEDDLLIELANAGDPPNPDEPVGEYRCVEDAAGYGALCAACFEVGDRNGSGIPDDCNDCPSDIDGDGLVGFSDIINILSAWGPCLPPPAECPADIDGDGLVGFSDIIHVLSDWGPCA